MTMRALLVIGVATAGYDLAIACPASELPPTEVATDSGPTTSSSCITNVDFSRSRSVLSLSHSEGATGLTRSGIGSIGGVFVGVDVAYGVQFGSDPDQPSYEFEISGGAALHRTDGTDAAAAATGVATRAALRLGPARVPESAIDEGRANLALFPLTMELSHAGEIAGRPRMSARPELARALFNRERVELASRMVRVEGAGEKAQTGAPGTVEKRRPSAWAIDVIPLHAGLDVAQQDATRVDATIGGSLLGAVDHSRGASLDMLRVEHRVIDVPMAGPRSIDTVWMLRIDGTNPATGTQYRIGWGEMLVTDELEALAPYVNRDSGNLTIGGAGWFASRDWGGWGVQYDREPFVSIEGHVGFEDRISAEVFVPRAFDLVARTFGAWTKRVVDDETRKDFTAGIEVDATYTRGHWSSKLGVEVGRTYYTALDRALPTTAGFGAAIDLSVAHTSKRTWTR